MKQKKDIHAISESLLEAGVKPTAQRIAVYQYIHNESDHPSPEQVKKAVDLVFPKISLATVYNTLNTLVSAGLINSVKLPHSGSVVYDANIEKHYHFIDDDSQAIRDLDTRAVNIHLELGEEFEVRDVDIFVRGHMKA